MTMDAIYVFGSMARRTSDAISDRDVLIVSDNTVFRTRESENWRRRGWSVAAYTPRRFSQMADSGSLFVQHIKQEGLPVADQNGLLSDLLASYKPKADYSAGISNSLQMLRLIERVRTGAVEGYWTCDILHTMLRNALILRLANEGEYLFSIGALGERLQSMGMLDAADLQVLAHLREAKAAYRARRFSGVDIGTTIDGTLRIVEKVFRIGVQRNLPTEREYLRFAEPYYQLRSAEKFLIENGVDVHTARRDFRLSKLWRMIAEPRWYSWQVRQAVRLQDGWTGEMERAHSLALQAANASRLPLQDFVRENSQRLARAG